MINIINLIIKYPDNELKVINNLTLDIQSSQIVCLAGANGCGKTTLLYALAGLIPTLVKAEIEGDIFIDNKNIKNYSRIEYVKKVGFIPSSSKTNLIFDSLEDNLAFSLENLNIKREDIKDRIFSLAKDFNLTHLLTRKCDQLSAGEEVLFNIFSVLIMGCEIILADEIFSNIDKDNFMITWNAFLKIKQRGGLVLLAEHSEEVVKRCDLVISLQGPL